MSSLCSSSSYLYQWKLLIPTSKDRNFYHFPSLSFPYNSLCNVSFSSSRFRRGVVNRELGLVSNDEKGIEEICSELESAVKEDTSLDGAVNGAVNVNVNEEETQRFLKSKVKKKSVDVDILDDRFKLRNGKEIFEENAYLVGVERKGYLETLFGVDESLKELAQLADTAGLMVVGSTSQKLASPNPRTYIGSGKVAEIKTAIHALDVETVIFDDELSAGKLRVMIARGVMGFRKEIFTIQPTGGDVRVCDRTALILDIFNQRAATHEAALQVALAQMEYQLPWLTKMWTHLERQAGGQVKGMGEKQIEVDKRILRTQVSHHPTLIACHCEGKGWKFWGDIIFRSKFWGRSIQLDPVGVLTLEFDDGEIFQWSKVTNIYNLILGKLYCDHHGTMDIHGNHQYSCKLKFKEQSILERNPHQIGALKKELDSVRKHRKQYRSRRFTVPVPVVSWVGYTNAGKSTLLNRLTGANVLAEDRLFATLDPTTRRVQTKNGKEFLLTDTVGFIQKLPTTLVAAFRETLEEIAESSLLVHVVDISHPLAEQQIEAVDKVLSELDVSSVPKLIVWNKVDKADDPHGIKLQAAGREDVVCISALSGEGLDDFCNAVQEKLRDFMVWVEALVPFDKGELLSTIHQVGVVEKMEYTENETFIKAHVPLLYARLLTPMRQLKE